MSFSPPLSSPVEPETPSALQPLAERMRPRTLDEFIGQEKLLGPGKPLRVQIESDHLGSMLFWGPPGCGKTTLARLIARLTKSGFISFSAVLSGIKEIKEVMAASELKSKSGNRTIVFIDEDDGAIAGFGFQFGSGHDFLDFLDAGQDRAERDEAGFGEPRNQTSESGFPAAGRAPEKHGAEMVRFDLNAERFAGAEEFLLADEFVKRAWTHALGERLKCGRSFRLDGRREWRGEAHDRELEDTIFALRTSVRFSLH